MTAEKLDVLRAPILETQQSLPWSWGHTLGERIITRQLGFPGWLSSKESACSAGDTGDVGSVHGLGRSPGGGNSNPLQYSCLRHGQRSLAGYSPWGHKELDTTEQLTLWASLVAQTVKNLPAMRETQDRSLGQEDPLEKIMATHSSILA